MANVKKHFHAKEDENKFAHMMKDFYLCPLKVVK